MTEITNTGSLPNKLLTIFTLILCLFPLWSGAHAEGPLAGRQVLANGMVLLHAEKSSLPIVQIRLGIRAGQIMESADKAGLSSLTASLLKEGTKSRSSSQISDAIEFVGGSLSASGGGENAGISLSVLKKDLDLGFSLLADILLNPSFPEQELDRKKTLVKAAIKRQIEDPGTVARHAFDRHLYGEHPFSWPAEGLEKTIDNISRQDVAEFHRKYYVPNNAWMAAVGDITEDEIKSLIDRHLGGWGHSEVALPVPPPPAEPAKTRVVLIPKDITQANIILGHLGLKRTDPDYYAVLTMNYILGGGGFASRLMDNIRDDKGLAYSVYSTFIPGSATGSFRASLETKNESANTAISELLHEMERIRREPVSRQELDDAKAYITGSFPLRMDSTSKLAGLLVSVEFFGLGMDYVDDYLEAVRAVTVDDVLRVARKYLHPDRYIMVVVANQDEADIKAAETAVIREE